jgi:16S rRNA (adenine1518-N6/adenine1519-N6)-dimethyltransferase
VTAIEMDRRCLPALAELEAAFPGRLRVVEGDAMKLGHDALMEEPYAVVANLPYNVGTALLVRWLGGPKGNENAWPPRWTSLTLMFQQEVAERITAKPDTGAYGRLAVLAQWRSSAQLATKVHRSAFTPPPKVMSAIVHIVPAAMPEGVSARLLERVTEAAFGQRRKMLRQSLKGVPGALDALQALGIDPQRRAETLTVADFVAVARALTPPR